MKRESDIYQLLSWLTSVIMFVFGNTIEFMDNHAGFIGGVGMFATILLNWYYQRKRLEFDMKKLEQDDKD